MGAGEKTAASKRAGIRGSSAVAAVYRRTVASAAAPGARKCAAAMPPPAAAPAAPDSSIDTADGWIKTGKAAYVAGHVDEAADAFARAVDLDPANGSALYNLGVVRNKTGDTAGAVDCFRQAAGGGHERAQKLLRSQKIDW